MSNWQLLLDTLSDYATGQGLLKNIGSSLETASRAVHSDFVIKKIILQFIQDYESTHKGKTRKNSETSKKLLEAARLSKKCGDEILHRKQLTRSFLSAPFKSEIFEKIEREVGQLEPVRCGDMKLPALEGSNENLPSASHSVKLAWSKDKGRHVVCCENIQMGDVIFVETPSAAIVNQDFQTQYCHSCGLRVSMPVCCESCNEVVYCSQMCLTRSLKSDHNLECGYLALLTSVGVAHLALRCLLVSDAQHYNNSNYKTLLELQFHVGSLPPQELFQYTATAVLLSQLLTRLGWTRDGMTDEDLSCALLRHILQMVVNAHAVVYTCLAPESPGSAVLVASSRRVSTGIYPSTAMMNHSCNPSVINSFMGNVLVVRAAKDLKKGDEVFNCYGPHYRRMSRPERKRALLDQYNFHCHCEPCSSSIDFMEILNAYACPACRGPLTTVSPSSFGCLVCHHQTSLTQEITSQDALAKSLLKEVDQCEEEVRVGRLLVAWNAARRALFCWNDVTVRLADLLARQLAIQGMYERSLRVSTAVAVHTRGRYGDPSTFFAMDLANLSILAKEAYQKLPTNDPQRRILHDLSKRYDDQATQQNILLYGQPKLMDDMYL